jgi:class 3 adenylate cyclase
MRAEPEHRAILALDIQGFGRLERSNLARARMRTGLHRLLGSAMTAAEIDPEHIEQTEYGDGVMVLLGPQVSKARLLHPLLPRLVSGLARYNRTAPDAARLRLRVALHAGELLRDAHGITGEDLIFAFRLLDADVVRAHLTQAVADLVLVVSDAIFQGIVNTATAEWILPSSSPCGSLPRRPAPAPGCTSLARATSRWRPSQRQWRQRGSRWPSRFGLSDRR